MTVENRKKMLREGVEKGNLDNIVRAVQVVQDLPPEFHPNTVFSNQNVLEETEIALDKILDVGVLKGSYSLHELSGRFQPLRVMLKMLSYCEERGISKDQLKTLTTKYDDKAKKFFNSIIDTLVEEKTNVMLYKFNISGFEADPKGFLSANENNVVSFEESKSGPGIRNLTAQALEVKVSKPETIKSAEGYIKKEGEKVVFHNYPINSNDKATIEITPTGARVDFQYNNEKFYAIFVDNTITESGGVAGRRTDFDIRAEYIAKQKGDKEYIPAPMSYDKIPFPSSLNKDFVYAVGAARTILQYLNSQGISLDEEISADYEALLSDAVIHSTMPHEAVSVVPPARGEELSSLKAKLLELQAEIAKLAQKEHLPATAQDNSSCEAPAHNNVTGDTLDHNNVVDESCG